MHQISFPVFAKQQAERVADFLDCASLPDYATAESLPAPVVVGHGVRSLREIRRQRCCAAVTARMLDGRLSSWGRWVYVIHGCDGPVVGRVMLRPQHVNRFTDYFVESIHRVQVAA
ncbi:hypothetical protein [Variovorax sp. PAMC26660]|uniref:hypothetical protein n=1 Tax=Variovorax sp. PAMC26660 TaxID=2762322 RepID=UPI00164E4E9E|nr:hypothetical protein [Variovorax sp. PAMC26660]QNK67843.1 hypothetical protein H7F35_32760 [Variovorax sp. PAMC26660]